MYIGADKTYPPTTSIPGPGDVAHVTLQSRKSKYRQFDNFVVTYGTVSCRHDNLRCPRWRQCCQIDNLLFSMMYSAKLPHNIAVMSQVRHGVRNHRLIRCLFSSFFGLPKKRIRILTKIRQSNCGHKYLLSIKLWASNLMTSYHGSAFLIADPLWG